MQAEQNPLTARVGPGTTDTVIQHVRQRLLGAIETVQAGSPPPMAPTPGAAGALTGSDTIDGIVPARGWGRFWAERARARGDAEGWQAAAAALGTAATTAEATS